MVETPCVNIIVIIIIIIIIIKNDKDDNNINNNNKYIYFIVYFLCSLTDRKYCVIQCTGYLKSWAPAKIGLEESEAEGDGEACNLSCLVAVGRVQPQIAAPLCSNFTTNGCCRQPSLRSIQFISRHAMDGKFLFVDQRSVSNRLILISLSTFIFSIFVSSLLPLFPL
jgi:hypothetical protein